MITAVLATLSLLSTGQDSTPPDTLSLGAYKIGPSTVDAKVVPGRQPDMNGTGVKFGEDNYIVDDQGRVVARVRGTGTWNDIAGRLSKAKASQSATAPVWRIKVFLLTRGDILETHANGMLRVRRGSLESPQLQRALDSLAILSALIESTTDGAVKPQVEVQLDPDNAPETASAGSNPFGGKFLSSYLEARVNGAGYEAEDRTYRGPYDSVFVIHAGLSLETSESFINDSPCWSIPYYSPECGGNAQEMATYLLRLWNRDVLSALHKHGYKNFEDADFLGPEEALRSRMMVPVPALPYEMPPNQWGKISCRVEPTTADYIKNSSQTYTQQGFSWNDVKDSPMDKLPWFQSRVDLNKTLGLSSVWQNDIGNKPRTQASFVLSHGSDQYVFVDLPFADFFGSHFPAKANAKALGLYGDSLFKRIYVVFRTEKYGENLPEISMLEVPNFSFGPDATPPQAEIPVIGNLVASKMKDSQHGDIWQLYLRPNPWFARLDLVPPGQKINLAANPIFNMDIKATAAQPWTIALYAPGATRPAGRICLFSALPEPVESSGSDRIPTKYLPGLEAVDWKTITIDFRQILDAATLASISQIRFETDPRSACYEPIRPAATVWIGKPTIGPSGNATALEPLPGLPQPNATDTVDPKARLSYILSTRDWSQAEAQANLLTLLNDSDDEVRLNACNVLTKVTMPGCESKLADALHSINTRVAEVAAKALAFQNTPEAWLILGNTLDAGPFEYSKAAAAKMLATRKDPKFAGTLSTLFVSRNWRVRMTGAEALQAIPGDQAAVAAMAFLQEDDPEVRLAVTQGANLSLDIVLRRLLWGSVNDASDVVRASSYIALIRSGKESFVKEGYKGVRDDGRIVRLLILRYLEKNPKEDSRDALRLAVADTDPEVRAAALDAFNTYPGAFVVSDVQSLANDPDPRVKQAYTKLIKARGSLQTLLRAGQK